MKCKDCEYYGTYDSPEGSTTLCKNENGLPGELDPEDGCSRGKKNADSCFKYSSIGVQSV